MDMRNDIATSTVAIIAAFVGDRYWKYADPIGACIVWYFFTSKIYNFKKKCFSYMYILVE